MLRERIKTARKRAFLMRRCQQERRLMRKTAIRRFCFARHRHKTRVILFLVGDVSLNHLQSVACSRFFAGDGCARKIARFRHQHGCASRVGFDFDPAISKRRQKVTALSQRLRM